MKKYEKNKMQKCPSFFGIYFILKSFEMYASKIPQI